MLEWNLSSRKDELGIYVGTEYGQVFVDLLKFDQNKIDTINWTADNSKYTEYVRMQVAVMDLAAHVVNEMERRSVYLKETRRSHITELERMERYMILKEIGDYRSNKDETADLENK